jgi:hypothetical protein
LVVVGAEGSQGPDLGELVGVRGFGMLGEGWSPVADPSEVAEALNRAHADRYRLTFCPPQGRDLVVIEVVVEEFDGPQRAVKLPPMRAGGTCELEQIVDAPEEAPLGLEFDAQQREIYDLLAAEPDQAGFEVGVRLGPGWGPIPAEGHLRGQTSLGCARKSYGVNLEGGEARPWVDGLWSDEAFLVAMCLDDRYVNQLTADLILAELGLFPSAFGLRALTLDGEARGAYLVLEEPDEAALRTQARVRSVIRRRNDAERARPEVKHSVGDPAAALAEYKGLVELARGLRGEALLEGLERAMDLDGYLRWVALMTLLENGDYVDEVLFVATDATDARGEVVPYFHAVGWDPDDLYSACHHGGRDAIPDPAGLLYCAEADFDEVIFADASVYRRYVEVLEDLIQRLTPEAFDAVLEQVWGLLWPLLSQDEVRGAMVEFLEDYPEGATQEGARAVIQGALDELSTKHRARRELLQTRISAWREAHP